MAANDILARYTAVLGPFKMEVVHIEAPTNESTFKTTLQNPRFGGALLAGDATSAKPGAGVAISGKTVTLHDPAASTNEVVILFGF